MIDIVEFSDYLSNRVAKLRIAKGVSARDMSLSLGQGAGYINTIENRKALPSLNGLYYICEYFNISPRDFFDTESVLPEKLNEIVSDMKELTPEQLVNIGILVKGLIK